MLYLAGVLLNFLTSKKDGKSAHIAIDNSGYILTAVVALVLIIGGGTIMTGKRRGG